MPEFEQVDRDYSNQEFRDMGTRPIKIPQGPFKWLRSKRIEALEIRRNELASLKEQYEERRNDADIKYSTKRAARFDSVIDDLNIKIIKIDAKIAKLEAKNKRLSVGARLFAQLYSWYKLQTRKSYLDDLRQEPANEDPQVENGLDPNVPQTPQVPQPVPVQPGQDTDPEQNNDIPVEPPIIGDDFEVPDEEEIGNTDDIGDDIGTGAAPEEENDLGEGTNDADDDIADEDDTVEDDLDEENEFAPVIPPVDGSHDADNTDENDLEQDDEVERMAQQLYRENISDMVDLSPEEEEIVMNKYRELASKTMERRKNDEHIDAIEANIVRAKTQYMSGKMQKAEADIIRETDAIEASTRRAMEREQYLRELEAMAAGNSFDVEDRANTL